MSRPVALPRRAAAAKTCWFFQKILLDIRQYILVHNQVPDFEVVQQNTDKTAKKLVKMVQSSNQHRWSFSMSIFFLLLCSTNSDGSLSNWETGRIFLCWTNPFCCQRNAYKKSAFLGNVPLLKSQVASAEPSRATSKLSSITMVL